MLRVGLDTAAEAVLHYKDSTSPAAYLTNWELLLNLFFASADSNSGFPLINASLFALLQF